MDPVWSQSDIFLITYGDTLKQDNQKHLNTLSKFLDKYTKPYFNNLHILPFFPFSSDDGFSITDYEKIRPDLGSWEDMKTLSNNLRLMSDVVINHASIKSKYFEELGSLFIRLIVFFENLALKR